MSFFEWSDDVKVGVSTFDAEHMRLLDMLNDVYDGLHSGKSASSLGEIMTALVAYSASHTHHEEETFTKAHYPFATEHTKRHQDFLKHVQTLQTVIARKDPAAVTEKEMLLLKSWLLNHIKKSDRECGRFLNIKGIC
jgi:hemerythrin-like metal-binding protein